MNFAWTAKGSHFEGRLPPAGGRCRAATKRGICHGAAMTGGVQLFILQNILPAAGFAVIAPVGVVKVCGAEDRRRGRLGFGGAVKGEPCGGAAGFDAEAHL